jgi:hypothetical protein
MVIGVGQSFPIDQLTTCDPSEQTVVPERRAEWAEAGADSATTPAMIKPATRPIRPALPRAMFATRFTTSPRHLATWLAEHNEAGDVWRGWSERPW